MSNILVNNNFYQGTSSACIVDLTPPTFAGISFLDVESRGQIRAGWSAATDATVPIRYEIYIKASTSVGLFSTTNIIAVTPNLQYDIFTMPDGSFLINGTTYYVGVRAIDGVNNRDSNLVSMNVISTGILTAIDTYECEASFSIDETNDFQITLWANKNGNLAVSPGAILGTASYQIYDKAGNAVVGMSGSGITANGQGLYIATPVSNILTESHEHHQIKISISVDGEVRTNFIRIKQADDLHTINGVADLDDSNQLVGSFWVIHNNEIATTNLGNGSYYVYTADGTYTGINETGIAVDVNGFFVITPFILPGTLDITKAYIVKLIVNIDNTDIETFITLGNEPANFACRATFSINALNQLQGSLWALKNDLSVDPLILGTASYQIYDKTGTPVAGLNQTGITADGNGYFHITPVSAVLLTDLTHYLAKVTISVAGQNRTSVRGFTLLGT